MISTSSSHLLRRIKQSDNNSRTNTEWMCGLVVKCDTEHRVC